MAKIPWKERIVTLSINPDMADRDDVARLASDLMDCRRELYRLMEVVSEEDVESIERVLA